MSRYSDITARLIHQAQIDYRQGRDLSKTDPGREPWEIVAIAEDTIEGDRIAVLPDDELADLDLETLSDWGLAILAERYHAMGQHVRAWEICERILQRPEAGITLLYEEVYYQVAQRHLFDGEHEKGFDYLRHCLVHNIEHNGGEGVDEFLRDYARFHVRAGNLDRGLQIWTAVLRHDPSDAWTYNQLGLSLPDAGLANLAEEAMERGLALLDEFGDAEGLRDQFGELLEKARTTEQRGREAEASPEVLEAFQKALHLPFDARSDGSIVDLAYQLIPDLADAPVKRRMTPPPVPKPTAYEGVGRNDPCPCGSGKKYKRCCWRKGRRL
ncbi:MAG: SEC-C metal-binding domain-containing protein [Anaerolineae bacterium]